MARQGEQGERGGGKAAEAAPEPYDKVVERLEQVVGELESGGLTLEQSIEKFAEGMRLVRDAARRLDDAERRVEQLVKAASGEDDVAPFDPGQGKGAGDGGR